MCIEARNSKNKSSAQSMSRRLKVKFLVWNAENSSSRITLV